MTYENNDSTGNQLLDNYKQTYGENDVNNQQAQNPTGQPVIEQNANYTGAQAPNQQQPQQNPQPNPQPQNQQQAQAQPQVPVPSPQQGQGQGQINKTPEADVKTLLQQQVAAQRETNSHLKFIKIFLIALAAAYVVGMIILGIIAGIAAFGVADLYDSNSGHEYYYNDEDGDYL